VLAHGSKGVEVALKRMKNELRTLVRNGPEADSGAQDSGSGLSLELRTRSKARLRTMPSRFGGAFLHCIGGLRTLGDGPVQSSGLSSDHFGALGSSLKCYEPWRALVRTLGPELGLEVVECAQSSHWKPMVGFKRSATRGEI
jgi:hypothetical protein